MKLLVSATFSVLVLFSGQSYAEQTRHPTPDGEGDVLIMPAAHDGSPFDFNHMSTGNDKSDKLGVPYYN